ncbi:hypothetical protein [Pseudoalteromonas ruthenica]|uniref:hypothetical protein n=1 Tax=Pseudoalteromonas ruthenica TaxID=151081 RepID=UPI00110B08E8|nr:hypothetical protein [Pseudoalteromonas ruthenica]TMO49026.1 hypothetical protein CWC24_03110 [Pseudoalteromonas ruthenica]TMO51155.1 hypothetical protein CWC23_08405 [Pseudoalteromonas ruthenica]
MKFGITLISLFCISTSVWSCTFPMSGEKYNKEIEIISTKDTDVYKFIIPSEMEGLDELEVNLGYSPKNAGGFKFMQESLKLDFKVIDGNAVGTFTVVQKETLLPFLHVVWWPETAGVCGVVASSDIIDVSNS